MSDYKIPKIDHPIDHLVLTSDRVALLREFLIEKIPYYPKKNHIRTALRDKSFNDLLHSYLNWCDRLIPPRPRSPMTWDGFEKHGSYHPNFDGPIDRIAREVEQGIDLEKCLSKLVQTHGFSPVHKSRNGVHWGDKDLALNAYDVHHLHLARSKSERKLYSGDQLLFVGFSRKKALFLMVGNHRSFDDGTLSAAVAEHRAGAGFNMKGVVGLTKKVTAKGSTQMARRGINSALETANGKFVMPSMLSSAGTAVLHTMHCDKICEKIERMDPLLDDYDETVSAFKLDASAVPEKPDWAWEFWYCDLHLVERSSMTRIAVVDWRR